MFLGCGSIKKLNELKSQFKNLLETNEAHSFFADDLATFFAYIETMEETTQQQERKYYNDYILNNANFHRTYSTFTDKNQKATLITLEKNKSEINKAKLSKSNAISTANAKYRTAIEGIEKQEATLDENFKKEMEKLNLASKREIANIEKEIAQSKKTYQNETKAIEKKQKEKLEQAKQIHLEQQVKLQSAYELERQKLDESLLVKQKELVEVTKMNDDVYVDIKKNFNILSAQLNKKIDDLKKSHQTVYEDIKTQYEKQLKPFYDQKEKLKNEYQATLAKSLENYQDRLRSLNELFDRQKIEFEDKMAKIIAEGNDAVTLLNSKLTAYKESIIYEKQNLLRKVRDEIPNFESLSRDQVNRIINRRTASLDTELNKQIIRTNLDILKKQREQQQKFYLAEQKHIYDLNEWRLNKQLYEFDKKQNNARIEANFNYNTSIYDQKIQIEKAYFDLKKELIATQRNIDLRKLETQLNLSSIIQDRELSLLSNDAYLEKIKLEHEMNALEHDFVIKGLTNQFENEKNDAVYRLKSTAITMLTQLEIEYSKSIRDSKLDECQTKIALNQAVLKKNTSILSEKHNNERNILEFKRNQLELELEYLTKNLQYDFQFENEKRKALISEASVKAYQLANQENVMRNLRVFRNEIDYSQQLSELLIQNYMIYLKFQEKFAHLTKALYQIPARPDVFKQYLGYLIELFTHVKVLLLQQLDHFKEANAKYFEQKISKSIQESYEASLSDLEVFIEQQNDEIQKKSQVFHDEISRLSQTSIDLQTDIQKAMIRLENTDGNDELSAQQQNQKRLILQEEIKTLKKSLREIDRSIFSAERKLIPFAKEIRRLEKNRVKQTSLIEQQKGADAYHYEKYANKHKTIYASMEQTLLRFSQNIKHYYNTMNETIYVTDNQLEKATNLIRSEISTAKIQAVSFQQQLLRGLLSFYKDGSKQYFDLSARFKKSSMLLLRNLDTTYQTKKQGLLSKVAALKADNRSKTSHNATHHNNQSKIDSTSYHKHIRQIQANIQGYEQELVFLSQKLKTALETINNNLKDYEHQLPYEEQRTLNELDLRSAKAIKTESLKNDEKNKQKIANEESLQLKNHAILQRTQNLQNKIIAQARHKDLMDEKAIKKAIAADQKKYREYQSIARETVSKRESEFRNILKYTKQFERKAHKDQRKITRKEISLLKKHHRFKLRMLRLK
ncbi:MAG: hypothetical protein WC964_01690 [Acholeplasmataceae bacterium]